MCHEAGYPLGSISSHLLFPFLPASPQVVSFQRSARSGVNTVTNLQHSPPEPKPRPQAALGIIWTKLGKGPCCAASSHPPHQGMLIGSLHPTAFHAPHRCSLRNFLLNHFDAKSSRCLYICTRGDILCALCLDTCSFLI